MSGSPFCCLVRGELRKVVLERSSWALPVAAVVVGWLAGAATGDAAARLAPFQFAIDTYRAFSSPPAARTVHSGGWPIVVKIGQAIAAFLSA